MPQRYARHYYDVYKIATSDVIKSAINDKELLRKVTEFKIKFYPRKWAKYEDAINKKVKLIPGNFRFKEIEEDYEAMHEMIYGKYPDFKELIEYLTKLEEEINA